MSFLNEFHQKYHKYRWYVILKAMKTSPVGIVITELLIASVIVICALLAPLAIIGKPDGTPAGIPIYVVCIGMMSWIGWFSAIIYWVWTTTCLHVKKELYEYELKMVECVK